jgi:type I restriction enzyme S subunit
MNNKKQIHNSNNSKGLAPQLRFPEFEKDDDWEKAELGNKEVSCFVNDKTSKEDLDINTYISTENILSDYKGIKKANKLPNTGSFTTYKIGDVLFANIRPYLKKVWFADKEGAASNDVIVFRAGSSLSKYFMQHILKNDTFINYVMNSAKGVKMPRGDKSLIKKYVVYLPSSLNEQQKIAKCLSSLDNLISAENDKLELLKEHKKGLLQNLFPQTGETKPKFRFPEFVSSDEWEEIQLIDVADKKMRWSFIGGPFGSNLKSSDYIESKNGVRIIQLQNIGDGEFLNNYNIYTSTKKADELLSNNIYPGDIIMSKMGDPVGRACLIPDNHTRYVMCSDGIRIVVDEGKYDKYFIYLNINSNTFRDLVEKSATGSTRKRIGLNDLKKIPLTVPSSLKEQQKIAKCLSSLDNLLTAQTTKIEALKSHKKGLMQQLFPNTND